MLSRFRALVLRFAGRQQLRPADAAVVTALLRFVGDIVAMSFLNWTPESPETTSFFDANGERAFVLAQTRVFLPGYLVINLAGLLTRKRWPDSRLLAYAAAQLAVINMAYLS